MKYSEYLKEKMKFDKLTWVGIFSMIIVISGVFGWVYEFIFYYFNSGMQKFYMRGSNFLPWINIYATGAIMIYLLAYRYREKPLKVFLIAFISTGILEYFSGLVMFNLTGMRCWDYNTEILNFGNIGGFVCLRSAGFFGLSGLILIYGIVPLCFMIAKKMNKKLFLIITISVCSIFLFDELYNLIFARLFHLKRASEIYKSIGIPYMNYFK